MIGLLHVIRRRSGKSFYEQFDEYPEIRRCVMEAIHSSKVEEYFSFVEKVLKERGHKYKLPECPFCGCHAVIGSHCEACFEDVSEVECPNCDSEFYIQSVYSVTQKCPYCECIYTA